MSIATKKVEEILTKEYTVDGYVGLIREIFTNVQILSPDSFQKEYTNFSSHIEGSTHIGNYRTPDDKLLLIFAVELKKESYVENSRSTQRSYAKKLIENGNADAALIAFYTADDPKWRLSFVRLDYEMKIENGRLKTTENVTPAKRYSYLVGRDEPCHTAISQLHKFIVDNSSNPTLDELEESFSVEKVTDEFFNLYKEKFLQLTEWLAQNEDFVIEAEQHNFTAAQFAKKLLGQIVFLYFLQKKGWLGVSAWPRELNEKEYKNAFFGRGAKSRELIPKVYIQQPDGNYALSGKGLESLSDEDEEVLSHCVKGRPWGTGSHNFMRVLFDFSQRKGGNFFDDYLEPLFYNALNVNRGESGYFSALHCRVPFLSGGLFEPIDGYDWEHNDFAIPDDIFSNKKDDNDREADGILDIFDRYNFTMSEDEPMEREVAIDPEMLGKVFENLLEVNDRKSKGAFYTPREIVHYMCQESLIAYLTKETGLKEEDVRDFILYGDLMKDEDTVKEKRQGNGGMLISEEIFKIDASGKVVVDRLKDIDRALETVRVADPAVGSGAFPLGMLNEIVRARSNISAYMAITMNNYETRMMYINDRSPYSLKVKTIKNCLFAADIEPSAVDIAMLRLWLSLVIDDDINPDAQSPLDGHTNPIPLPNLECNILCGNSLVDEFMGVSLLNKASDVNISGESEQINLYTQSTNAILPSLLKAQEELFYCSDPNRKPEIKQRIEALRDEIISIQLCDVSDEIKEAYEESKAEASKPYMLWQLDFARVFQEKGGFDIVIGNPPYVDSEEMTRSMPELRDLYAKKYKCTKGNWDLYIPFWERAYQLINDSGRAALITPNKWLAIKYGEALRELLYDNICNISDYTNFYAFESAGVSTVVVMVQKDAVSNVRVVRFAPDFSITKEKIVNKEFIRPFDNLALCLSSHFEALYKVIDNDRLEDYFNISGAATVSETYEIAELVEDIPNPDLNKYFKFINTGTIEKFSSNWGSQEMTYVKSKYMNPVVSKEKLQRRFPRRFAQAKAEKLITTGIRYFKVYGDFKGEYLAAKSTEIITMKKDLSLKALLPILNSNVTFFFLKEAYGGIALGGGITFSPNNLSKIPIPTIDASAKKMLEDMSDNFSKEFTENDQNILDNYIYKLFNLSIEEISIIEDFKITSRRKR